MMKLFSKNQFIPASLQSDATRNALTPGSKIVGHVVADTDFRVDGTIEGDVHCKGSIVVGAKAHVKGDIVCHSAEILGNVVGSVRVEDTLAIHASGSVQGDVETQVLVVEPKAFFSGSCAMNRPAPVIEQVEAPAEAPKEPAKKQAPAPAPAPVAEAPVVEAPQPIVAEPEPIVAEPEPEVVVSPVNEQPMLDFETPVVEEPVIIEQPITIAAGDADIPIIVEEPVLAVDNTSVPVNPVVVLNEPRPLEIVEIEQ